MSFSGMNEHARGGLAASTLVLRPMWAGDKVINRDVGTKPLDDTLV